MPGVRLHVLAILLIASSVCHAQTKSAVDSGQALFQLKCGACHSVACSRLGPKLEGVFGRTAGGVADYQHYSPELKASGIVWTDETLDAYLRDPARFVPGTRMDGLARVENANDRKTLIAYMRREDRSADLCPR